MVLRDLLRSDTLHQRDAIAVGVALRALTSPSMALRERMLEDATTPEQRNPSTFNAVTGRQNMTKVNMFGEWRNGFMAGITAVLGHPVEVENCEPSNEARVATTRTTSKH